MEYLLQSTTDRTVSIWVQQRTYPKRKGYIVVDSRHDGEKYPDANDAQGWNDLRTRKGCLDR